MFKVKYTYQLLIDYFDKPGHRVPRRTAPVPGDSSGGFLSSGHFLLLGKLF